MVWQGYGVPAWAKDNALSTMTIEELLLLLSIQISTSGRNISVIRRRHHFARECVDEEDLVVEWIAGESNPADILTKPVTGRRFTMLKKLIGTSGGAIRRALN